MTVLGLRSALGLNGTPAPVPRVDAVYPVGGVGAGVGSTGPLTWSHTVAAGATLLLIGVAEGSNSSTATSTVTYGGVTVPNIGVNGSGGAGANAGTVQLFALANPPAGTATVSVTGTAGAQSLAAGSVSYFNAGALPAVVKASSQTGAPSVAVPSTATDSLVVDVVTNGNPILAPVGAQVQDWLRNVNNATAAGNGAMSHQRGGGTVTMAWTITTDWWAQIAVAIPYSSGLPVEVNAGVDGSATAGSPHARIAQETLNGAVVTSRAWTIVSGPAGVGTTIGTAAQLAWTPSAAGTYTIRYTIVSDRPTVSDDATITVAAADGASGITGLLHRMRPRGLGITDGGNVPALWFEVGGLAMGPGNAQPTLVAAGQNGRPALRFDGSSQGMASLQSMAARAQPLTVALVMRMPTDASQRQVLYNQTGIEVLTESSAPSLWAGTAEVTGGTISPTSVTLVVGTYNGATSTIHVDDVLAVTGNPGTSGIAANPLQIGAQTNFRYWPGDMYELLIYDHALSAAERTALYTYHRGEYAPSVVYTKAGSGAAGASGSGAKTVTAATTEATITDRLPGVGEPAATAHNVPMPSGTGGGVLVAFTNDEAQVTASTSSVGWEAIGTQAQGTTTNHRTTLFWAADAATAAALVVNTAPTGEAATWVALRVSNGGTPVVASTSGAAALSFTPPPLTGLTSGDYLAVLVVGTDSSTTTAQDITYPAGWVNKQSQNPTITTSGATFTAEQMFNGVTAITPATVGIGTSEQWVSLLVAFPSTADTPPPSGSTNPRIRPGWTKSSSVTTSMSTNRPASPAVNDYLLALHCGDADTTGLTAAGFAQLAGQAATSGTNIPMGRLWGKVATAADVAAATFPFGCTSSATPAQTVILLAIEAGTYDTTTPVTVGAWTTQTRGTAGTGVAQQTLASIAGVVNGLLLGLFDVDANGNQQTYPATASGMDLVDYVQTSGGYSLQAIYSQLLTAAGATGAKTVTPVGTNTSNGWATLPVIINPAPVTAVTYTKAGGGIASGAGSGARSTIRVKTGAGVGSTAGSGPKTTTGASVFTKTGSGAARGAGSGARVTTAPVVATKTGSGAAGSAGSVFRTVTASVAIAKTGAGAASVAGSGAKIYVTPSVTSKTGSGVAGAAGSGAKVLAPAAITLKTGAGTTAGAGAGAKVFTPATVNVKTGSGASRAIGVASKTTTAPTVVTKTGSGAAKGAGSGPKVLVTPPISVKTGSAAAITAGSGSRTLIRTDSGSGVASASGSGAKQLTIIKTGGAVASGAGAGAKIYAPPTVNTKTGGAFAGGSGVGVRVLTSIVAYAKTGSGVGVGAGVGFKTAAGTTTVVKTGAAAGRGAGSGARTSTTPTTTSKTGSATGRGAGSGARATTAALVAVKTGAAVAGGTGFGARVLTRVESGAGVAAGAGSGAKLTVVAGAIAKTGAGAGRAAGSGARVVTTTAVTVTKAGAGVARGVGSVAKAVTTSVVSTKTGSAATQSAGAGPKVIISPLVQTKTGSAAATAAASGLRVGGPRITYTKAGAAVAPAAGAGTKINPLAFVRTKSGGAITNVRGTSSHAFDYNRVGGAAPAGYATGRRNFTRARTGSGAGRGAAVGTKSRSFSIPKTGSGATRSAGVGTRDVAEGPPPPVTELAAPTDVTAVWNTSGPNATLSWTPTRDSDSTEVHEFNVDPANTLKATLPFPTGARTSNTLTNGFTYAYAVRARRGDQVSPFSIIISISNTGQSSSTAPADPGTGTGLAPPTNFACTIDTSTRIVTNTWVPTPNTDSTEIHEFLDDPANTLADTVAYPGNRRVSSPLTMSRLPYLYAARAVKGSQKSGWSNAVRVFADGTVQPDTSIGVGPGVNPDPGTGTGTGTTTPPPTTGGTPTTVDRTAGVGGIPRPAAASNVELNTANRGGMNITASGTASAPRIYDGGGFVCGPVVIDADYIVFQNYNIRPNSQYGVYITGDHVTVQNCDIKNVRVSGDGDLNAFTVFGADCKLLYNTSIDFVSGDPGGSHTDWCQTWVSSSHTPALTGLRIIGNVATGPANPSRDSNIASIHQFFMCESAGHGGNSGGSGTPTDIIISDNTIGGSWGQEIKVDAANNVQIARNKFVGSSDRCIEVTSGTGVQFFSSNVVGSGYGQVGTSVVTGDGPANPYATVTIPGGDGGTTTPPPTGTTPTRPGDLTDLSKWEITLPTGPTSTDPTDIYAGGSPDLATYSDQYFTVGQDTNWYVQYTAPVTGPGMATTSSASGATRSELREMATSNGGSSGAKAAWSFNDGIKHEMTETLTVDPSGIVNGRKEGIIGQIHGTTGTPPIYLAANFNATPKITLFKNGPSFADILTNITATTKFTYRIIKTASNRVQVFYALGDVSALPATPQYDWPASDFTDTTGCYFKVGAYNKTTLDDPDATGSLVVRMYYLTLDGVGWRSIPTGGGTGGTPAGTPTTPAEALWIGSAAGRNHYNIGIAVSTSTHTDFTQTQISDGLSNAWFKLSPDKLWVIFIVDIDGQTTSTGTKYARSELRELNEAGANAAWNGGDTGTHRHKHISRVIHVPPIKPSVCFTQVHDSQSDLARVQTESNGSGGYKIVMRNTPPGSSTETVRTLNANYTIGDILDCSWSLSNGTGTFTLNGTSYTFPCDTTGCYFKSGAYAQTNETIDAATETCEVWVKAGSMQTWHTGYAASTVAPWTLITGTPAAGGVFTKTGSGLAHGMAIGSKTLAVRGAIVKTGGAFARGSGTALRARTTVKAGGGAPRGTGIPIRRIERIRRGSAVVRTAGSSGPRAIVNVIPIVRMSGRAEATTNAQARLHSTRILRRYVGAVASITGEPKRHGIMRGILVRAITSAQPYLINPRLQKNMRAAPVTAQATATGQLHRVTALRGSISRANAFVSVSHLERVTRFRRVVVTADAIAHGKYPPRVDTTGFVDADARVRLHRYVAKMHAVARVDTSAIGNLTRAQRHHIARAVTTATGDLLPIRRMSSTTTAHSRLLDARIRVVRHLTSILRRLDAQSVDDVAVETAGVPEPVEPETPVHVYEQPFVVLRR